MQHARRDALIGVTAVAGFVGVIAMLFLFGELSSLTRETYRVTLELNSASGLSSTSPVTLNGVRVGEVTSLRNADDPRMGVIADVDLLAGTSVPEDVDVFIDASLLGQAALDLRVRAEAGDGLLQAGGTYRRETNSLLQSVRSELAAPVERVATAADRVAELAASFSRVGAHVETLLEPRSIEEVDAGQAEANVTSAVARLDATLAGASAWTNDETLRDRVAGLLTRGEALADRADELAEAGRRSLEGIDATRVRLEGDATASLAELREESSLTLARIGAAADEIRAVGTAVNSGDGTAARLLRDPELYNNLSSATKQLESAITSFELLVEKFKAEGVPLQL